ncbi:MAG: hypothetical protein ACFBSD_00965 [Paracoccaceae bacterium]
MAKKNGQMFDMLRQIIDKYDETDTVAFTNQTTQTGGHTTKDGSSLLGFEVEPNQETEIVDAFLF